MIFQYIYIFARNLRSLGQLNIVIHIFAIFFGKTAIVRVKVSIEGQQEMGQGTQKMFSREGSMNHTGSILASFLVFRLVLFLTARIAVSTKEIRKASLNT